MADETKPQTPQPVGRPSAPVSGTATVTVACKVMNGLELREYEMGEGEEPIFGGGKKTIKVARPTGRVLTLAGPARSFEAMRRGIYPSVRLAGGAALTSGVPRDLWESIEKIYTENRHPAFINRQVFSVGDEVRTAARAEELAGEPSGTEPLDPSNPVKRTGIRSITSAERPAA